MSNASHSDLLQFQVYLTKQVQNGNLSLSPEECLARYRAEHPTTQTDSQHDLEEIREAVEEMDRGDHGRPYHELLAELRQRYRLPAAQ